MDMAASVVVEIGVCLCRALHCAGAFMNAAADRFCVGAIFRSNLAEPSENAQECLEVRRCRYLCRARARAR